MNKNEKVVTNQILKAITKYNKSEVKQLIKLKAASYFYADVIANMNSRYYKIKDQKIEYSFETLKNKKYIKIWVNYNTNIEEDSESERLKRFGIDPVDPDDVEW